MQNRRRGVFLAWSLLIAAVAAFFLWPSEHQHNMDHNTVSESTALIGGPFTMVNHRNETVTERAFAGKYMMVFFGFTHCDDVCPTELQVMTAALQQLGHLADKVTPVFVTVDPERDTPQIMAEYVKAFDPRLQGLTGTPEQIAAMTKAYHVFYKKVPAEKNPGDYEMDHTSIIYVMGPTGAFVKHFTYTTDANGLAEDLRKVLNG